MKLPKFSIVTTNLDTLILHGEEHPFHFAKVLKFPGGPAIVKALIQERVPGYNIIIALAGSMEGRIYVSAEGPARLQRLVREMSAWFTNEVIDKQSSKYKRYKI